jgi:hypothetical protein
MYIKKPKRSNTKIFKKLRNHDKKTTKSLEEIFRDAYGKNGTTATTAKARTAIITTVTTASIYGRAAFHKKS